MNPNYYETKEDTDSIINSFNEKMEIIHISELEEETLKIVKEWEAKNL